MGLKWTATIHRCHWGSEIVVFHQQSGETTLFSDSAEFFFDNFQGRGEFTNEEVKEVVYRLFGEDQIAIQYVRELLDTLIEKEFIVYQVV